MASRRLRARAAGPDHQVVTIESTSHQYRRTVCRDCPWRVDATGTFPPEAFVLSAPTSYDVPVTVEIMLRTGDRPSTFSCHSHGTDQPITCAGFLLRDAAHNLAVRMAGIAGRHVAGVREPNCDLHENYRAMAIANGVPADHPALEHCREDARRPKDA